MDCPKNKQRLNKDTASQVTTSSHQNLHIKSNSSFLPPQGPEGIERGDSSVAHVTDTPSRGTLSPSTLSRTTREPQSKGEAQNIPGTQPAAGAKYTFVKHSATISQTSISSSPPPKIFTPTNASSSGQSFSDLSITSLQVQESYNLFNVADYTERGNPQAEINTLQLSPANSMHHVYHASTTTDYHMGEDSFNTHGENPDINSQMNSDVDFESFIHSEGFLPLDQSSSNVYNLRVANDSCNLPTSINPRRLSKTPLTEPLMSSQNWTATSSSPPSKEAFEKQKACDEDQMAVMLITHLLSPATSARHGGSSFPGFEGNNPPVRVCPAPIKTSTTRSPSGKSSRSCNTRWSSSSGGSLNTVIRDDSVASTASQDSRYGADLHRGTSAPSRDDHLEDMGRRASTNSSTTQESQREGGEWNGACSNRLRNANSSDAPQRPSSSSDRDSFPGGRESISDDVRTFSARIRRRRAFSFGYKGRPWATHRGAFLSDRDQIVEELSSGLGLVHI